MTSDATQRGVAPKFTRGYKKKMSTRADSTDEHRGWKNDAKEHMF